MQKIVGFLGRLCFSAVFILAGINKIINWDASEQQLINQILDLLSQSYHQLWAKSIFDSLLSLAPTLLFLGTVAELAGGALVILGIQVRFGAFLLALFLIPTTFLFHNFWDLEGAQKQIEMVMFMKNLGLLGGALILLALGKGSRPPSKQDG